MQRFCAEKNLKVTQSRLLGFENEKTCLLLNLTNLHIYQTKPETNAVKKRSLKAPIRLGRTKEPMRL